MRLHAMRAEYAASVAKRSGVEGRRHRAPNLQRDPHQRGVHLHELNGACPPMAFSSPTAALPRTGPGALRHQAAGAGFVHDRGFASIGYGLPAAIGAALAGKGRPVVAHRRRRLQHVAGRSGDGAAQGLSFAIVVFNNAASGYVKALQHLMYGERRLPVFRSGRDQLRQGGGGHGLCRIRVEDSNDLKSAFTQGLAATAVHRHRRGGHARPARMLPAVDNRAVRPRRATGSHSRRKKMGPAGAQQMRLPVVGENSGPSGQAAPRPGRRASAAGNTPRDGRLRARPRRRGAIRQRSFWYSRLHLQNCHAYTGP